MTEIELKRIDKLPSNFLYHEEATREVRLLP